MRSRVLDPRLLRAERPSRLLGVLVSLAAVAVSTGLVYPLKHLAPVQTLGVVYLLAVVIVSLGWGLTFGLATAVLSAAAFNLFHLPPVGELSLRHNRDWVGLAAFAAVAVAVGLVGELARSRARELEERRREADLASELAQLLLGAELLGDALAPAAGRLAQALGVSAAEIRLQTGGPAPRYEAPLSAGSLPLRAGDEPLGTLELPAGASPDEYNRARERVVPALESILAAALHREELRAELVETAALRRSDEMKTAVLRSVSHDLRTPVTAILTAAGTLDPLAPSPEHVGEVRDLVLDAATRLWLLIEKLLDLSLLQAGRLEPVLTPCSIEDVLHEAVEQIRAPSGAFSVSIDRNLPPIEGDPAQLERAFVNVIENAARYSAGKPVSVRARVVGERLRVRIVDQGPGIEAAELERVFLPFYRGAGADPAHHGSGLGLAIARGFVEVNGGRIDVESHPGQGTSFVVEFPLAASVAETTRSRPPAATAGER
ncbi:MAG TPA: ATP-binding protein [Solirubrobacteraceae bacterium]|jgi:two-component system sensor histidine kinase KdpD|nr:ATP-binding protein [Solirubrobacteraceae bacterium]